MRLTPIQLLCLLFVSSGLVATMAVVKNTADGRIPGRLVVHEWGTFTNFSGSDGVKLDFRPLVANDLPKFVLDRAWQAGIGSPFSKSQLIGRQRMETPVTYFYTDAVRDVNVQVGFPEGLLTEFYPPVRQMSPPFKIQHFGKPPELGNSALNWGRVTLIPESKLRSQIQDKDLAKRIDAEIVNSLLPDSANCPHYAHARETDSAIVHVKRPTDPARPRQPTGNFFEKFLFYRGVGNFSLPLELVCDTQNEFTLTNAGEDDVRSLFLVSVDGGQLRFESFQQVDAGQTQKLTLPAQTSTMDNLCKAVANALIAENLYEKEAWAMVNTWRDSWFGEQGTRLFYLVPSSITEELLPLNIKPVPDEVVRVLVGRMEIMTPQDEAHILQLVEASQKSRKQHHHSTAKALKQNKPSSSYQLPAEILKLGRFAEPALIRVIATSTNFGVRAEGRALLQEWRLRQGIQTTVAQQ